MRVTHALLTFFCCVGFTTAQPPKPQSAPDKTPARADKDKPDKKEPVAGYRTKKIEDVTFLVSEEALNADISGYERPPLDVLAHQVKAMKKALPPKAVELLHKLVIWVEWDKQQAIGNGRQGISFATYYGASPQKLAAEGKNPLQSKTITVHSLKYITEKCQPKDDTKSQCLLLHEFAHAGTVTAFQQAMERKLYERDFYAATNHIEFFAELSCAYLDRLPYYPHNREDLRKHDPVTFKAMETAWGKPVATEAAKLPMPHSEKANREITVAAHVKFGTTVVGPEPNKLSGKVVLIGYWGNVFTNVLTRLDALDAELADYGLVAVAPCAYARDATAIKAEAEKRGIRFAVLDAARIKETDALIFGSPPGGHAVLFDHTGKCLYRGSAYDVADSVRAAVGASLASAAFGAEPPPKALQPIIDAFAAGASPVAVLPKLAPLTTSSDADTKAKAKKLYDLILAPGEKVLTEAQTNAKADPLAAFLAAERVAARFKSTPLATKATALVTSLKGEKVVAAELKARPLAAEIDKAVAKLRGQDGSFNPSDPKFQTQNQKALAQLKAQLDQLRKTYPAARATAEAEKAAREFGVN
jgi:hypothetical protein